MFEDQLKASRSVMEPQELDDVVAFAAGDGDDDAFDDVDVQLLAFAGSGYDDAGFQSKIS